MALKQPADQSRTYMLFFTFLSFDQGLNTAIFTFISIGYWYIYLAIKQTSIQRVRTKGQSRTETVAARKMALLVFTNVLCWFPTFVIGEKSLKGTQWP